MSEIVLSALRAMQQIYCHWHWYLSGNFFTFFCSRRQHYGLGSSVSVLKTFSFYSNKNVQLPSRRCCTRLSWSDECGYVLRFGLVLSMTVANYLQCVVAFRKTALPCSSLYISSVSYNWLSWMLFILECLELTECSTGGTQANGLFTLLYVIFAWRLLGLF